MARKLAIDLGAWAVKVAVWHVGASTELEGVFVQRVPQDPEGGPPSVADRIASLDLLLRAHPEWTEGATTEVTWSSERSSVRRLKLPFTDPERIAQTLPFTIEAEVPFDLDTMLLGWRPAGDDGELVVVLAPEEPVDELLTRLKERRLDPRRLVPDGEVLGRYAQYADAVTAVIDVGHTHSVITVARDGAALTSRSVDVAGRSFTRAVQVAIGCAWHEAEALKHGEEPDEEDSRTQPALRVDLDPTDPSVVLQRLPVKAQEALRGAVGLLLAEVRGSLVAAEDELGVEVEEVVLVGGGARIPELRGWLEQDLGVPVREANLEAEPVLREHGLVRALLADLVAAQPPARVDLRVGDLAYKGGFDATNLAFRYGGAFLGSFLVGVTVVFMLQLQQMWSEARAVDTRLREVVASAIEDLPEDMESSAMGTLLAAEVSDLQDAADFLGTGKVVPPTLHELFVITKAMPAHEAAKLNVDRLEITPGAILISGVTEGLAQVDLIRAGLEGAGRYDAVETQPGTRDTKGHTPFTVNIDRAGGEDDTDAEVEE